MLLWLDLSVLESLTFPFHHVKEQRWLGLGISLLLVSYALVKPHLFRLWQNGFPGGRAL